MSYYYSDVRTSYDYESREAALHREKQILAPLIDRLAKCDRLRASLGQHGAETDKLTEYTRFLGEPISFAFRDRVEHAPLTQPDRLRSLVSLVGRGDYYLDVRRTHRELPVYSLSRVARDYWSEYSLVVEDLHHSPGFPSADSRFARYMNMGHEIYYLRMSPFRVEMMSRYTFDVGDPESYTDDLLHRIGHYCLSAMWHEDQRPAVIAAQHLGLHRFLMAIELLYLSLSADLCTLRVHVDPTMRAFFREIYPQPAVRSLLESLPSRDGRELYELPQMARRLFVELNVAFRRFLETEVMFDGWLGMSRKASSPPMMEPCDKAPNSHRVPVYKLLFANLYRLDQVASALSCDEALRVAVADLESSAGEIIDAIGCGMPEEAVDPYQR